MRGVYGAALVLGMAALIAWIVAPARSGDRRIRTGIGSLVGLGMAGLSASYAGWPGWVSAVVAATAAVLGGWWAGRWREGTT
jgi:hypothetical protein